MVALRVGGVFLVQSHMSRVLASILAFLVPSSFQAQTVIPEGTRVRLRLEQTLSSATAEVDQQVQLAVVDEIKIGNQKVISQGANATGSVVLAQPKRRMGRTGKLDFSVDRVTVADGATVPLRYSLNKKEGGSHSVRTGVITAGVAVLFWPAAPFMLLMKGKDISINKGVVFEVFTDAKYALNESKQTPANLIGTMLKSAVVSVLSPVAGAEIDMDGAFVGNTPASLQIPTGVHKIRVKSGGQIWEKTVQVLEGSSLTLNAVFEQAGRPSGLPTANPPEIEKTLAQITSSPAPAAVASIPQTSSPVAEPAAPLTPVAHLIRIVCPEKVSEVPFSSSRPDRRRLACDEPVTIVSESQHWIRVRTAEGIEGNVAARFVGK